MLLVNIMRAIQRKWTAGFIFVFTLCVVENPEFAIRLVAMTALGPFSWRWPEGPEAFERGWAAVATVDGREFRIRHGIGHRDVYGVFEVNRDWVAG